MSANARRPLILLLALSAASCHYTRSSSGTDLSDLSMLAEFAGVDRPPTIYDFAWLEGSWRGEGFGGTVEEAWSAPADGAMVGHFRYIRDGEVRFYEIMTIGPVDATGRLGLKVKHFHPDLRGWEERDESMTFVATGIQEDTYRFDGLTITRVSGDEIEMELSVRRDGQVENETLRYHRVR